MRVCVSYHGIPLAGISLTHAGHSCLLPIAFGRSSSNILCQYRVVANSFETVALPLLVRVRNTLHMSSPLLFQQCPACLIWIIRMVFETVDRCSYSCSFAGSCSLYLINIACSMFAPCRRDVTSAVLINFIFFKFKYISKESPR